MGFFMRKQKSRAVNRRMKSASRVEDVDVALMGKEWFRRRKNIVQGGAETTINSNDFVINFFLRLFSFSLTRGQSLHGIPFMDHIV